MRRGRPLLAAALVFAALAAAAVVSALGGVSGDRTRDLLPDLDQATPSELGSETVEGRDGPRFLLGFESAAANVGEGPLVVVGSRRSTRQPQMTVVQRVERADGTTRTTAVAGKLLYVRSADHAHWHLLDFMRYELRTARGRLVAPDRKTGFCLGDRYAAELELERAEPEPVFTGECGKGARRLLRLVEGISVGYGDDYAAFLEGQSFDVTGLPAGRYLLVHRVNAGRAVREADYGNNAASLLFSLTWPSGRNEPPGIAVLRRCPNAPVCS